MSATSEETVFREKETMLQEKETTLQESRASRQVSQENGIKHTLTLGRIFEEHAEQMKRDHSTRAT